MNRLRANIGLFMVGFVLVAATVAVSYSKAVGVNLSGAALVQERCTQCHDLMRVERRAGQDRAWWERTVDRMESKRTGLLSDTERIAVIDHLVGR